MVGEELIGAGIIAMLMGMIVFILIAFAAIYVYMSMAFMAIARKARLDSPGLAWIPGVGPLIIAYQTSKMHWWPWLLLISLLVMWIPVLGVLVYFVGMITFAVFAMIWQWKMFETVGKPGWWVLLALIPFVGGLIYLVMIGIAAWSKN